MTLAGVARGTLTRIEAVCRAASSSQFLSRRWCWHLRLRVDGFEGCTALEARLRLRQQRLSPLTSGDLDGCQSRVHAAWSRGCCESSWRTRCLLHADPYGTSIPVLPISPDSIRMSGGYRSVENYISNAWLLRIFGRHALYQSCPSVCSGAVGRCSGRQVVSCFTVASPTPDGLSSVRHMLFLSFLHACQVRAIW